MILQEAPIASALVFTIVGIGQTAFVKYSRGLRAFSVPVASAPGSHTVEKSPAESCTDRVVGSATRSDIERTGLKSDRAIQA